VLDRLNTGIMGSNPVRDMAVCPRFSVFCCPVYVEVMRWAKFPSKDGPVYETCNDDVHSLMNRLENLVDCNF